MSTTSSATSSGRMSCKSPQRYNSIKPLLGVAVIIILFNSSSIRSPLIILIRSALRSKASKVSSSMKKLSCVAKRTQRIIRNGSSEKVTSGSSGVRIIPSQRSSIPPNGSTNSPKRALFKHTAIALIVKSRRF